MSRGFGWGGGEEDRSWAFVTVCFHGGQAPGRQICPLPPSQASLLPVTLELLMGQVGNGAPLLPLTRGHEYHTAGQGAFGI